MSMITILLILPITISWAYRGGSLPKQQEWGWVGKTRWLTLLATPLFTCGALWTAAPEPFSLGTIGLMALSFVLFFAAQADGWGRQMDLGKDPKPDDETGHGLRDLIWEEKSGFLRDLTGLYMRFSQFLGSAFALTFISPWATLPSVSLWLLAPIAWVIEDKIWYQKELRPPFPFVEYSIGALIAVTTALACWMM
jgi:hypothetical protein